MRGLRAVGWRPAGSRLLFPPSADAIRRAFCLCTGRIAVAAALERSAAALCSGFGRWDGRGGSADCPGGAPLAVLPGAVGGARAACCPPAGRGKVMLLTVGSCSSPRSVYRLGGRIGVIIGVRDGVAAGGISQVPAVPQVTASTSRCCRWRWCSARCAGHPGFPTVGLAALAVPVTLRHPVAPPSSVFLFPSVTGLTSLSRASAMVVQAVVH